MVVVNVDFNVRNRTKYFHVLIRKFFIDYIIDCVSKQQQKSLILFQGWIRDSLLGERGQRRFSGREPTYDFAKVFKTKESMKSRHFGLFGGLPDPPMLSLLSFEL